MTCYVEYHKLFQANDAQERTVGALVGFFEGDNVGFCVGSPGQTLELGIAVCHLS